LHIRARDSGLNRRNDTAQGPMQGVDHYENFPVASWLCPPQWRPAVQALYHFARTADDLADEGHVPASDRLRALASYRSALLHALNHSHKAPLGPWPQVFTPLAQAHQQHHWPRELLLDLLDAFEQDVRYRELGHWYADLTELQDYCRRSARPVGRLLLHLCGQTDPLSLQHSDAICDALQLINFWQDLGNDLAQGRHYLPLDGLQRHGLSADTDALLQQPQALQHLVEELCLQAHGLMWQGAPLALQLPGRMGWELRLVVQGGLRVLEHAQSLEYRTWLVRPRLSWTDLPVLLWRAWRMPATLPRPGHAETPYTRQP